MALRKSASYSHSRTVPYTRVSKKKNKSFIKVVPPQKIVKFTMGKEKMFNEGKLPHFLEVFSQEEAQVRDTALEACRQYLNKKLDKELSGQYMFKVHPFPHHIQRENKMLTGAGADRMQTGMQLSFGKSIAKSALLKKGSKVFSFAVQNPKAVQYVRKLVKQIRSKLPFKFNVVYTEKK
jgi:large subunit ribosomal protein L10e